MRERIVMLGAGAVGGYVGGHLALHGHDVTLIDFWSEHIDAIRQNGLELSGMTEEERQVSHPKTMHLHEVASLVTVYDPRPAYYAQIGKMVDLDRIRKAFLEILQGQFHPRITYPGTSLPEPSRGVWLEGATIPEKEK